ncbi:hypothetical protein D9613_005897 [Agrocybe pediades]|uniref:FHA domain-containing protein n=1 Tax=Agrocybe pediades TaxID=84607 RepID=A0A8H4QVD6_9AGAR|nr:hypothetical protein D9613_005897 [Agrocybe pediades]
MSRRSRSPPPRRRYDDESRAPSGTGQSSRRGKSRERDSGYDTYNRDRDLGGPGRDRERNRDRDYGYNHSRKGGDDKDRRPQREYREYTESTRERERERDRERYDSRRNRDREYGSSSRQSHRRSASPPSRARSSHRDRRIDSVSPSPSEKDKDKLKPNFAPSGLLAAETNTVKAVDGTSTVLKYNEPPEARKPVLGWRLYVFKDAEQLELLHIHRQSAYLVGRDRLVADIALEHPSCSKQHAVFQYRYVQEKDEYGGSKGVVKPFVIDLESTNGTFVNDEQIPAARYYELKAGDVIKFGLSTREYVLLHDDAS